MDRDELVSTFCGIADCDAERAKFFLSAANWQLEVSPLSYVNEYVFSLKFKISCSNYNHDIVHTNLILQTALNTFLDPSGMDDQNDIQEIPPPTTTASHVPPSTTASQPPTLRDIAAGRQPPSRDPPR